MNFPFNKIIIIGIILFLESVKIFGADVTYSTNTVLSSDLRLSLSQRAIFDATLTLDAAGYFYQMPITPDPVLIINNGYTATLQNILIQDFSNYHLNIGSGSSIIFGNGSVVSILLDQVLTQTLNFSGNTVLTGSRNTIDLGTGAISVQPNSCLTISNLNLINVIATNLGCVDNTGSITFQNVVLSTPSSWNFNKGSFLIKSKFEVSDGIFCYTSGMSSTIATNSKLIFSNNLTFSYDPAKLSGQDVASRTNLNFTDTSSWLVLAETSLCVTTTGMHLLKGSLGIFGRNYLYSDATLTPSEGLCIGDGINLENNMNISTSLYDPNVSIYVKKGLIVYQNVE